MTTRALEDHEIKAIFEHIEGCNAKRNETLMIVGVGMALRASELVGLKVSDVCDTQKTGAGRQVKSYVTIRAETAKFGKERTIRIGDGIQQTLADFLLWKAEKGESLEPDAPLFVSQRGGHLTRQGLFDLVKRLPEAVARFGRLMERWAEERIPEHRKKATQMKVKIGGIQSDWRFFVNHVKQQIL